MGSEVDASGSLIVSDHATGKIVWVPNVSGTLTTANDVTIEKNPSSALGIALDAAGNLYTTDATGKAVYAIQRTAAAINLGTVSDGITNSATVYLESNGNLPATLAAPVVTNIPTPCSLYVPAVHPSLAAGTRVNMVLVGSVTTGVARVAGKLPLLSRYTVAEFVMPSETVPRLMAAAVR